VLTEVAMYTTERILDEIRWERGSLVNGRVEEADFYEQVWDAFNRYVTATIEQKRTLDVPNFCKIGWRIEQHQSKVKRRPHFQLADSFVHIHQLDATHHSTLPDSQLISVEEFNFSKAAIKYSRSLTKSNLFIGLRTIVHRIGEACTRHEVRINFEIGQMLCKERSVCFSFVGDVFRQEGLDVPKNAADVSTYKPSRTFCAPSAEALTLNVRGTSSCGASAVAASVGGVEDRRHVAFRSEPDVESSALEYESKASDCLEGADAISCAAASELSTKESVLQSAIKRHLEEVNASVEKAMHAKEQWDRYADLCESHEKDTDDSRRKFAMEHQEEVKRQLQELETKRRAAREHAVMQASQHDFPQFIEQPTPNVREYMRQRKRHLRDDLHQQVYDKHRVEGSAKQLEREMEKKQQEYIRTEAKQRLEEEASKKALERKILLDSWNRSIRLKQAQKCIESHHMTRASQTELDDVVGDIRAIVPALPLQEPKGGSQGSGHSSRPPTGSVRRMPIGAAASLALQRNRGGSHSAR